MTVITKNFEDENGTQCVRLEGTVDELLLELQAYKEADRFWKLHPEPRKMVVPRGLGSITLVLTRERSKTEQEFPQRGPYTEEMMQEMSMTLLQERAWAEYGLKDRGKNSLIRKILNHYNENKGE